jgi:NADH:ubiquinone oxidoreductase subunit K
MPIYLTFTLMLFIIGVYACVAKRNLIRIIIGIDILTSAINLNFIVFSTFRDPPLIDPTGHGLVIILIALEGGIITILLGLVVFLQRRYGTLDIYNLRKLQG